MLWGKLFKELHCSRHSSYGMKSPALSPSWRCWCGQVQMAPHGTHLDLAELAPISLLKMGPDSFRKGSMHCDSVFPGNRALLSWRTVCPWIVDQLRSGKLTLSSHHHWELWCQNTLVWVLKSSTDFCASVTCLQFRKNQVCLNCLPCAPSNLDCVFFFQYMGQTSVP